MKKKKSNEMDYTDGILSPDGILFTNYNYVDEQIDVDNVCYSYFECSLHVLIK